MTIIPSTQAVVFSKLLRTRDLLPLDQLASSICATRRHVHTESLPLDTNISCPYATQYRACCLATIHATSPNEPLPYRQLP